MGEIKKHILNEKAIYRIANDIIAKLGENPDEQKNRLKLLKKERATAKSQIAELLELRSLKLVNNAYVAEHMAKHDERIKELDVQIMSIEQQSKATISHAMIVDYLNKMLTLSDATDDETLQIIFNNFVDKIVIDNETIEVYLFVSPTVDEIVYKVPHGQPKFTLYQKINRK